MNKGTILSMAALAAIAVHWTLRRAEARPDAISAASLTVGAKTITSTSATITWSRDKYDYGDRTLCYDPAPAAPKNNCVTKTVTTNSGSFNVTGLKPATTYNFSIKAVDTQGGEKPYTSTGEFTTLTATGVVPIRGAAPIPGVGRAYDLRGRKLDAGKASKGEMLFVMPRRKTKGAEPAGRP